ncbi:MAG TPA: ABC transporter C-terminal domain-containing protein, partial [Dehalococcoidia bacterium]
APRSAKPASSVVTERPRPGPPAREQARRAKEVERLEAEVGAAESRLKELMAALERASAARDADRTGELGAAYADAEQQLHELMAAWEAAAQAVEAAAG